MIARFEFHANPKLIFGQGRLDELPDLIAQIGKRCLIVRGRSLLQMPQWESLISQLKKRKLQFEEYEISGEPSPDMIDEATAHYRDRNIHVIVAIGGGSVIDAGKAISAMIPQTGSVENYLDGIGELQHNGVKVPFIAAPTTAGTGSEATKNAVISRVGPNGYKRSLRHDNLIPNIALIDPELLLTCPPKITAASGMDALTQLIESYLSVKATPLTDWLALSGLNFFVRSFGRTLSAGNNDIDACSGMAYAAYISGVCLTNAGLGLVHGLSSVIGGWFNISHGVVCGTLIAATHKAVIQALMRDSLAHHVALDKYATIGKMLSNSDTADIGANCTSLIQTLEHWVDDLKFPRLSEFGISEADISRIVQNAENKNSPVKLSQEEISRILIERM